MNKSKILLAGKIAKQTKDFAKSLIKKGVPLVNIADKIEDKIISLGGRVAFPTSLAIDSIAAHNAPIYNDETKARGLLKVDLGVHVDGWVADIAFSVDLEDSEENKKLIEAAEMALQKAIEITKKGTTLSEIGKAVEDTIESYGFNPIRNLCGHSIEQYNLHAGISIPNFDNSKPTSLPVGLYAIEPFATTGAGKVHDGKSAETYMLISSKNIRDSLARKILKFIEDEYNTLPFCSRWIVKKFGTKAMFALKQLEQNKNLHQFAQLIESSGGIVSQAEETILIGEDGATITSE